MNIKDSYLHSGTHLVKNISFTADSGTLKAIITWALEGTDNTEISIPTIGGASFGSLTANYVLAAPNGSAGNPTFRALVAADIPNLSANKITSDTLDAARLPLALTTARGAVLLGVAKTSDADSAITGKKYWVKMNTNGKLFVDIPWENNTHYTATPVLGGSTATSNATTDTANNATYLNIIENSTKSGGILITGDGTGTTVKANNGVLTITSKWLAATTSQAGYVPTLAIASTDTIATQSSEYVLTYKSGTETAPVWRKLPENAFLNTWRGIQNNLTSLDNTTESLSAHLGYLLANGSARDNTKLPTAGGEMTGAIKRYYGTASDDPMITFTSYNQDIWLWRINDGSSISMATSAKFGYGLKYLGTGSENNNKLVLYSDNQLGTQVAAMSMQQNGTITLAVTPNVNGTNVSLAGHKHAYTDLTGSSTTADQAIVSNGTANGWTLKTLGSNAFNSTAYVPIAGNVTMTGPLGFSTSSSAGEVAQGINFGSNSAIVTHIGTSSNLGLYTTGTIYMRPNSSLSNGTFSSSGGVVLGASTFTYNGYTIYHSNNIPSNSASAKGVVPAGVASSVYMTDSTGAPSWTVYDTAPTSNSGHLITSGAVYTAIANVEAGGVQYLGTVASSSAMTGLTAARKGDFARVITSFSFTDATGESVTAHVGDVVYLTNDTPGTAANWIVAHTEIDTDTWTAASTTADGYIPALATGGTALAAADTDYVLAYVNGLTTPLWKKLPANAYKNDNTTGVKLATVSGTKKTDSTVIKIGSGTGLSIAGGTNKFSIGDGTNYIEVGVAHGLSTKNITINGSTYALYTSASSLPIIVAPTSGGTGFLKASTVDNTTTWSYDNTNYLPLSGGTMTGPINIGNASSTTITTNLGVNFGSTARVAAGSSSLGMYCTGTIYIRPGETITNGVFSYTNGLVIGSNTFTYNGNNIYHTGNLTTFGASGTNHSGGLVPDTPSTEGTTKFLCEDGTWKLPSYTTNTDTKVTLTITTSSNTSFRPLIVGKSSSDAASPTFSTVTDVAYALHTIYVKPSTGDIVSSGSGKFSGLTCTTNGLTLSGTTTSCPILWNSGSVLLRISITDDSTADTAVFTFLLSSDSGSSWTDLMTIKDNSTIVATTFSGALSGNATTATNLSKTSGTNRGYLYLSANTTTACTGVGSVSAASEIGLPYIGYSGSANTYGIYKDLFYLSGDVKYIGNNVHSNKFACVKTKDSTTDDWTGSSTSGSQSGSGTNTYTAGTGININNGVISTTRNEWYGTEALFNNLASLDANTTYYITAN